MIIYTAKYKLNNKTCFIVADLHADIHGAALSKKQRDALLTAGKNLNAFFIVEDMWDYQGDDPEVQHLLTTVRARTEQGCLLLPDVDPGLIEYSGLCGFIEQSKQAALPTHNVEFRHYYLLNIFYATQGTIPLALTAFDKLLNSFSRGIEEIKQYQDDPRLHEYYQEIAPHMSAAVDYLTAHARKALSPQELPIFLDTLWECMLTIFDARLIHAWYQASQQSDTVIVYAGGEHAMVIEQWIQALGYKQEAFQGNTDCVEYLKQYRHQMHGMQPQPGTGLITALKNRWLSWQLKRMRKETAKQYRKALENSQKIAIENSIT